ncbi:pirin family protein [Alkalihalobacillus sp. MEB203]|uniref:Pirin family protein n=1 Tax=Alkalihalobacterium chitinilyticum TaxID=2980103 RepID=A0ABT5VLK0_9BACI|nr:pirin-like C-terminal cupin domain-containing protein [Alkalihalobacterium chitinilyticum]MDE5416321.1 pirin family protein [Alkalihalobacterium chitinilyticum]
MTVNSERSILKKWDVTHQVRGAGHTQGWVLEPGHWYDFDPFLLMAEDWFKKGTFGFHPHKGMETVTYVIDGELEHKDSHGGEGLLKAGDVQWMTAGQGISHIEDPVVGSKVHSLQLWVNLSKVNKSASPRYQDLYKRNMPEIKEEGAVIRLFSGSYGKYQAETLNYTPVTMIDFEVSLEKTIMPDIPKSYNGFIYILEGSGLFGKEEIKGVKNQVIWLGQSDKREGDSDVIRIKSTSEKLHGILLAGEPIKEQVVAHGPFVMNTEEEIRQAFSDYHNGKFQ